MSEAVMPGSSIFILLLASDHLSMWIALSKNEWFYQYSQQNIFDFISVRSTVTNLESLVSWPWDATFLGDLTQRMNEKHILFAAALYTRGREKLGDWQKFLGGTWWKNAKITNELIGTLEPSFFAFGLGVVEDPQALKEHHPLTYK